MRHSITLQTDHFQFFLEDREARADTSDIWSAAEIAQGFVSRPGFLAIPTARYGGETRIIIEVLESHPPQAPGPCGRLVRCSLDIPSGQLDVSAPESSPQDIVFLKLAPNTYEVLICFVDLHLVEDEFASHGEEYYHVFIWPA